MSRFSLYFYFSAVFFVFCLLNTSVNASAAHIWRFSWIIFNWIILNWSVNNLSMITELPKAAVKIQKIVFLYWLNLKYSGPAWTMWTKKKYYKVLKKILIHTVYTGYNWFKHSPLYKPWRVNSDTNFSCCFINSNSVYKRCDRVLQKALTPTCFKIFTMVLISRRI